ncbi:MAG TPA: tetratricopeptide repeat protein [Oculatellaceae cyanobacterium]
MAENVSAQIRDGQEMEGLIRLIDSLPLAPHNVPRLLHRPQLPKKLLAVTLAAVSLLMTILPSALANDLNSGVFNSFASEANAPLIAQVLPGAKPLPSSPPLTPAGSLKAQLTTLRAAVKSQQVSFKITGDGVTTAKIHLQLTNNTTSALRLVVPQNEVFRANSANFQTMMVTRDALITLKPNASIDVMLDTICASTKNMMPPPSSGVSFEVGAYPDQNTWQKMSRILAAAKDLDKTGAFASVPLTENRLQTLTQYAIWKFLGLTTGDPKDQLNRETIFGVWTTELNEQVKHNPQLSAALKQKGQLGADGTIILDKKEKDRLDSRIDLILQATDLTLRRSDEPNLPGIAGLPSDSTWGNLDQVGVRAFEKGDYTEAQELLEGAVKEAEKFGDLDARLATSLLNLSRCLIEEGLSSDALPQLQRALTIREKSGGKDSIDYAAVANTLGVAFFLLNKAVDAEQFLQTALNIRQQKLGQDHPEVAESLIDLGKLYCNIGKLDDAEHMLKQALAIRYKLLGGESTAVADVNVDLADVYKKSGKFGQAEKMYMKALAIDNKALGQDNAYNATILASLADVYKGLGKDKDAQLCTASSDAIKQKVLGANVKLLALLPSNSDTITRVQTYATANVSMEASMKEIASSVDPKLLAAAEAEKKAKGSRAIKDKWALVIGISKYQDSSINLHCSANDARDFANFLIKDANFAPDHVRVLTDDKATKRGIEEAFGDKWLPRVAGPDDLVVFYFSGHGSPAQADAAGINYLVAYDTDKNSLFSTGISLQAFTKTLKSRVQSDRILLVMDACHSGAATEAESGAKGLFRVNNFSVDEIVQGSGQFVICSSQPNQSSWESKKYPNGVFTHYLIEGLKSQKKLGPACEYMKDKVQREVLADRGVLQDPVVGSNWYGEDLIVSAQPSSPVPGLPEDKPQTTPSTADASKAAKGAGGSNGAASGGKPAAGKGTTTASKSAGSSKLTGTTSGVKKGAGH